MKIIDLPANGQRFILRGTEYEISYFFSGTIRYANVKGGRAYTLPLSRFQELQKSKKLILCEQHHEDEFPAIHLIDRKEAERVKRKLAYLRALIKTIGNARSKRAKKIIAAVAVELRDKKPPSSYTCSRWLKIFTQADSDPRSLISKHRNKGNSRSRYPSHVEKVIAECIENEYLNNQRITMRMIYGLIKEKIEHNCNLGLITEDECIIPSERSIGRRIRDIDPYIRSKSRYGRYQAEKLFRAAGVRDFLATRILEYVEADGNLMDVQVVDEDTGEIIGRPYATCIIDQFSRCILALEITMAPYSAATILSTLKTVVSGNEERYGGVFETIIVDNGSDYISDALKNCIFHIGSDIKYAAPYKPNEKAYQERFFHTFNTQFCHTLPGTTFSSPADRGDYDSEKHACLTLTQLKELAQQYLDEEYHCNLHTGHGRVPKKLWEQDCKITPVTVYPLEHMDQIARVVHNRIISKGRVTVHNLQWYSHRLATIEQTLISQHKKPRVTVYVDDLNLNRVFVKWSDNEEELVQADSVKPVYTNDLTLFEHRKLSLELREQGRQDLLSISEEKLRLGKWNFREKICEYDDKYHKKMITRLKESDKKSRDKKAHLESIVPQIGSLEVDVESTSHPTHHHEEDSDFTLGYTELSYDFEEL